MSLTDSRATPRSRIVPRQARPRAVAVLLGATLLVSLALPACSDHGHGGRGADTGAFCPTPSTLTFANFGQPFVQAYCLRCHSQGVTGPARMSAPADHNFDNAVDIGLLDDHIDRYAGSGPAATNTRMPPGDPRPSIAERKQLSEWLACGAP